MSDKKFHLRIPRDSVKNEPYEKTGGGSSVQRVNHSEHGIKIREASQELIGSQLKKRDSESY